jgi:hypothetical protein
VLDDFRIAADNSDSRFARGFAHGLNFCLQNFGGQARFEYEGDDQSFRFRAGNRQIIDGSVDGELANGAAGKTQRLDDETVRGDGDARTH